MRRTDSLEKTLMLGKIEGRGKEDIRWWDDWMSSLTRWTWVWVSSGSWTGKPGMLQSMGWQRVVHNWTTERNWWYESICELVIWEYLPALGDLQTSVSFGLLTQGASSWEGWMRAGRKKDKQEDLCLVVLARQPMGGSMYPKSHGALNLWLLQTQ